MGHLDDDLVPQDPEPLGIVFYERLKHLNLEGQIEEMKQAVGALGASCDIYTGYWRDHARGR